ncbi:eukaryotic translation initiation factor 2 subunit alpha, partial [Spiromyces aspiralis]
MSQQNFRFYRNKFPKPDDLVMVKVTQIAEIGAYVVLEEYGDISGMILSSELSRRRIRSIQKLVRVGKRDVAMVMRVDEEKGYIDLSKRRVLEEDKQKCLERFERSRTVHSILRNVSANLEIDIEQLYEQFGWPLYD